MKIHYVKDKEGNKLFSFHRHDYRKSNDVFIDGGFDYVRTNTDIYFDTIENLISDIRNQFMWKSILNEDETFRDIPNKILLKNMDTDHIINVLIYFIENIPREQPITDSFKRLHLIFLNELKYREKNNIE